MKKTTNIFLIGPMGAGKSSIGRALAERLQRTFYDSDDEIVLRSGTNISWIFDVEGEAGMRAREAKVIDDLTQHKNIVLATGGGSIITPENRQALAARGTVFYLKASIEQQVSRTERQRDHRPLLRVDDPRAKITELMQIRGPLYEEIADYTLLTDNHSVSAIVDDILQLF